MESMLNVWVEDHDKKVYEQVGFWVWSLGHCMSFNGKKPLSRWGVILLLYRLQENFCYGTTW
jgi:hypothetical protein